MKSGKYSIMMVECVFAVVAILLAWPAQAAHWCRMEAGVSDFGRIVVPRDVPVGGAIGAPRAAWAIGECGPNRYGSDMYYEIPLRPSALPDVWDTGIKGLGVRITDTESGKSLPTTSRRERFGSLRNFGGGQIAARFSVQLVKIGDGTQAGVNGSSGSFTIMNLTTVIYEGRNQIFPRAGESKSITVVNLTPDPGACKVKQDSIVVALPGVPASGFPSVGSVQARKAFNLELSCPAGINLSITLSDAGNPGNTGDILTPGTDSTASGVALQILRSDGSPVRYGSDSSVAGNLNQWKVGSSENVSSIPLFAQYIATGRVRPGTVEGMATFTFSYQ